MSIDWSKVRPQMMAAQKEWVPIIQRSTIMQFERISTGGEAVYRYVPNLLIPLETSFGRVFISVKRESQQPKLGPIKENFWWQMCSSELSTGDIAQFVCVHHPERSEWRLDDRIVAEPYRGKANGIADTMLALIEDFVRGEALRQKTDQQISANLGQVSVLLWLLKNGYTPPEGTEGGKRVAMVLRGDDRLLLAKAPGEELAIQKRQGYIFEKTVYDQGIDWKHDEQLWRSFRIRLEKSFSGHLPGIQNDIREQLLGEK
jgi:hypothetical protein